ncbi:MAG: hypothetical protein QOI20_3014 [Acidimicrobiaceae bacterium]|nr:hypothetical protein [Acidimicrobiaceae bacterium]
MRLNRPVKVALILVAAMAVLATAGTWVYIHLIEGDAPDRLSLSSGTGSDGGSTTTTASAASAASGPSAGSIEGTWKVASGSQAGYRVKEVLFGQNAEAVGRTSSVTGSITISGTTVASGSFTVDLRTVSSDQDRRDGQFQGRIMNTSTFPTATFKLTQPIALASIPDEGKEVTANATGQLTMHGVTKPAATTVQAQRSGSSIKVAGTIPVTFSDYGIDNPSAGPARVGDNGEVEFLLVLSK